MRIISLILVILLFFQDISCEENATGVKTGRKYIDGRQRTLQRKGSPQDLVSEIHCMRSSTLESFTAFLKLPEKFSAAPVLENKPELDSSTCLITKTNVKDIFALDFSKTTGCGVRSCNEQGEEWMCIMVRFPLIEGLKMPEDEIIDIKCKPQDRSIAGNNIVNFQENAVEQRSPAVFLGGGQEFLSEIGLFRKLPGTNLFASRVKSGSTIELGENIQLRSIVRGGDGWKYAKMTNIVVHRVHDGNPLQGPRDSAALVDSDGCRNPSYLALAPSSPWRDGGNPLINNFDFRVFMFQEMLNGDTIMITSKIMACVEEIDCSPVRCGTDSEPGYGRKRRSLNGSNFYSNSLGKTQGWEENVELKIKTFNSDFSLSNSIPISESECKLYLIITLSVALTFCLLSGLIVIVACFKRYKENRISIKSEKETIKIENENRNSHSVPRVAYIPYYIESRSQGSDDLFPSSSLSSPNKPVTVRSVKRRDKAKTERQSSLAMLSKEENAVMV